MKEIMAIVRLNKVGATKKALEDAGFPAFTCRKVMGRGKKAVSPELVQTIMDEQVLPLSYVGECMTEGGRLIPKRVFVMVVPDDEVEKVVEVITTTNCTKNAGDGKIFILPVTETYRVRDGVGVDDVGASY